MHQLLRASLGVIFSRLSIWVDEEGGGSILGVPDIVIECRDESIKRAEKRASVHPSRESETLENCNPICRFSPRLSLSLL